MSIRLLSADEYYILINAKNTATAQVEELKREVDRLAGLIGEVGSMINLESPENRGWAIRAGLIQQPNLDMGSFYWMNKNGARCWDIIYVGGTLNDKAVYVLTHNNLVIKWDDLCKQNCEYKFIRIEMPE